MPAALSFYDAVGFGRTPGVRCVLIDRRRVSQDRVYHTPSRLDRILAHEERWVASQSIPKEALIGRHLVGRATAHNQFHSFAPHGLSRDLGPGTERDEYIGAEAEAVIVRLWRLTLTKHGLRRGFQFNQDLGGRLG